MALSAVIFDVDGTLVDTNALHVEAFVRAFASRQYKVPPDRVFREIGKGGDNLVPALIGREGDQTDGDAIRNAQPREYQRLVESRGCRAFPGGVELIRALGDRAIQAAIATSSSKEQLQVTEKGCGIEFSRWVDVVVMANHASTSKPAPDIVAAAVRKLGMSPAQCAMVGDTPYDATSSLGAGVACLGVTSGGHEARELISCGARAVWRDVGEMLAHLENVLQVSSPQPVPLTHGILEKLMGDALRVAGQAMSQGEVPIGALIARGDLTVIGRGFNRLNQTGNKTAHAEIIAFSDAAGKIGRDARDSILVSTLEPCVMCTGAAMEAGIDTIVFGLHAPADGGTNRVRPPTSPESQMPRIVGGILEQESRQLLEQWLRKCNNNPKQIAYVNQLLRVKENEQ
jgi:beta-phosphoglucomutase-like phosphatase (HAD superfamily)/tRNA(Arg) A34 adenosine deaminase TadA